MTYFQNIENECCNTNCDAYARGISRTKQRKCLKSLYFALK